MNKHTIALAGGIALLAGACKDNPAAPSIDRVVAGSQQSLQTLATGFVAQDRNAAATQSYYAWGDIFARDAMRPDPNEPRYVVEFYVTPPDPSGFVGGAQWTTYYFALRAGHALLRDQSITSLSTGDQAAARGFIRTVMASEYLKLIELRDQNGVVIQGDSTAGQGPLVSKQAGLKYTSALLDSAQADLKAAQAAGTAAVPFSLPSGYRVNGNYTQVSQLLLYNQGLKGKAEAYRGLDAAQPNAASLPAAKAALDAALADAPAAVTQTYLNKGPYYEFNPAAPESYQNPLVDPKLLLTVNFVNSIQTGDARASKIIPATAGSSSGFTSAPNRLAITNTSNTANLTTPLPILRNGELYLLRAQVEAAMGQLAAATADVNVIRTVEGGLPAYSTFASLSDAQQAILYAYRYSFILQGPQHLVALREYKALNNAYISQPGIPTPGVGKDPLNQMLPIPAGEAVARGGNITPQQNYP